MTTPHVSRPHFPEGYADHPKSLLPWEEVENRLMNEKQYWLCSVRPNGRPHSIPIWAVWMKGRLYFDGSPQTRHARNIAINPFISLHLESGQKAVMVDGTAREIKPTPELAVQVAQAYTDKYAASGYSPQPDSWDAGGLFEITPQTVIAWNNFTDDPTRFAFPAGSE